MKNLPNIKDFILSEKDYFADKGIDIDTVKRKYKREVGMGLDRKDVSEALTSMKRDRILQTNWKTQKMDFV